MISASSKVYTPGGWVEARHLKAGDTVYSWKGKRWFENAVTHVNEGRSRTALSIVCLDGIAPTVFQCTPDQEICRKWPWKIRAEKLLPGQNILASEGVHVFTAEIALIELSESAEPQPMVGFELAKDKPYLAGGFLCR